MASCLSMATPSGLSTGLGSCTALACTESHNVNCKKKVTHFLESFIGWLENKHALQRQHSCSHPGVTVDTYLVYNWTVHVYSVVYIYIAYYT